MEAPSTMDYLQFVALCMEIVGIGMAALHVFNRDKATELERQFERWVIRLEKEDPFIGLFYILKRPWDRVRWAQFKFGFRAVFLLVFFGIAQMVSVSVVRADVDLTVADYPLVSLLFSAIILATAWGISSVLPMLFSQIISKLSSRAGAGDFIVGLGIVLASLGLMIEAWQVWESPLWWWEVLLVLVILALAWVARWYFKAFLPVQREKEDAEAVE